MDKAEPRGCPPLLLQAALDAVRTGTAPATAQALLPLFTPQRCARGQTLLAQGQVWRDAFIVQTGLVRMHFVHRDGRDFNKNFFTEGALVCPLTPAMWSAPSLFTVSALEATTLWRCVAADLRRVLDASGDWAPLRTELLSRLLSHKLQREHDLLAHEGRRRYLDFCAAQPLLSRRVPLKHLASYLGMTDVSLSRVRRQLRAAD